MKIKKILATLLTSAMIASTIVNFAPLREQVVQASEYPTYDGNDLGCTYTKDKTTFKVWAPTAKSVVLNLYATGSDKESGAKNLGTKDMVKDSATGVWSITVEGDLLNEYYTYTVNTDKYGAKEVTDVYGKSAGVNGNRSMVIDLDSTDPTGWDSDERVESKNQSDAIVYELHVKDFSYDTKSGISAKNRGKYTAFTESGTTLNNDGVTKTGIDYLEELGVTHVQILPSYDYGSVDEREDSSTDSFNWGYDPKNYNTPEGSYSTNPYDGNSRVNEYKQMVQSLHDRNIGVIMDVVYNHTYEAQAINDVNPNMYSPLEYTVPGYYYTSGSLENWSGCGNAIDSTKAMSRKYIVDSVTYWAKEYHLDGFRFDLMGITDTETMKAVRKALDSINPDIKIFGEPWTGLWEHGENELSGYTNMANMSSLSGYNISAFNDKFRDNVRGNNDANGSGYIQGDSNYTNAVKSAIQGNSDSTQCNNWAKLPFQSINYTSCHDNHTLWDTIVKTNKSTDYDSTSSSFINQNKLAAAITMTSQGVSFFQAGEEFARTKYGDHNSYKSSANINKLDWTRVKTYSSITDYYKGLIEIRRNFDPFRDPTRTSCGQMYFSYQNVPDGVIAYTINNKLTASSQWKTVAVAFNNNSSDKQVTLASSGTLPSKWVVIANNQSAGVKSLGEVSGSTVTVPAQSALILVDKESFDSVTIPDRNNKSKITVEYVDEKGNKIADSTTKSGSKGSKYTTEAKDIDGYVLSETPSNATGTFTDNEITVTYVYKVDTTVKGTVTTKYIDLETNKSIKEDKVTKGAVDSKYTTSAEEISGYVLDDTYTPSNAKGTYTEGNTVVKYYYVASGTQQSDTLKVHYYNANSWKTPSVYIYNEGASASAKATEYTGAWPGEAMTDEGDGWWSYEVKDTSHALVIINDGSGDGDKEPAGASTPGYNCTGEVKIKGGKVEEVSTTINKYVVRTKFVDSDTDKEIADSVASVYDNDAKYTTKAIDIDGYELDEEPTNASGTISGKNVVVTYKYKSNGDIPVVKGSVTIKYVDEDGNKLDNDETITGNVGDKYTTSEKEIEGYVLVKTPTNAKGTYTEDDITVTYVYKEKGDTPTKKGTVIVKYVNIEDNKEIADSETLTGIVGAEYSIKPISIDGYTLVNTPANATGTYTEDDIIVTFKYKKTNDSGDDEPSKGKVIIKYIDSETGKELRDAKTLEGNIGEEYTIHERSIAGYTLLDMPENASGVYTKEDIIVELKYKVKSSTQEPGGTEETSDKNPIAGLALLGLASMIIGIRIKKER